MMLNIYQRLNEVRKAVSYIQKDKEVRGGGSYLAVTHDAVTAAVRDHLVKHGVIIAPHLAESKVIETGTTTSSGVPIIRYEGTYDICFINCDEPSDRHVMRLEAHALDFGDKAPGKAISYATKYAMLKLFSIETGDAEEERIPSKGNGKPLTSTITATTGAWENVPRERHEILYRIAATANDYYDNDQPEEAWKYLQGQPMSHEEKIAVWTQFDSKRRTKFKKFSTEAREREFAEVKSAMPHDAEKAAEQA